MGRPKGSGRGLVLVNTRIEPDVLKALDTWASHQGLSQAEAVRRLLDGALQHEGVLKSISPAQRERKEALIRARAELHQALNIAWDEVTK